MVVFSHLTSILRRNFFGEVPQGRYRKPKLPKHGGKLSRDPKQAEKNLFFCGGFLS